MTADKVTDQEIARVAALLAARAGFRHDPLLVGRLARSLQEAALDADQPVGAYLAALPDDDHALQRLLDRVTIQESRFFRDEGQFGTLVRDVLPALPPGVIWSAGCANGQEPWSLAITLLESGRTDCSILATDISTAALRRAEDGRYDARELRGLSSELGATTPVLYLTYGAVGYNMGNPTDCRYPSPVWFKVAIRDPSVERFASYRENVTCLSSPIPRYLILQPGWLDVSKLSPSVRATIDRTYDCSAALHAGGLLACPRGP